MEIKYGRKRSGIIKELNAKMEEWLETIDDKEVAAAISGDTIITGGSIASMLMGDPINDFDIYFRTKESALIVANYYVKRFNEDAAKADEKNVVAYQPYVKEEKIVNCKGVTEDRVVIWMQSAGVAAIDQKPYQYFETVTEDATHAFGDSLYEQDETPKDNKEANKKYRPVFLSQNAITLSDKMQIVIRFFGSPDQIHDNYDFIHAMNYYDYGNKKLELKLEALEALLSRTLIYKGSLYPIASVFRTKKFIERGWRISAGQQIKMMWQISELDLKDFNVIREQLTGVDQAYLHQLKNALEDVDPEKINSSYIATIVDRIFIENSPEDGGDDE